MVEEKIALKNRDDKKCYELIYKLKSPCRHCPMDKLVQGITTRMEIFDPAGVRWFYRISTPVNLSEKKTYFQHLLVDITESKRNEEHALSISSEKDVLLREIHHRVKNNLQLMLSLIRLQELNSSDASVKSNLKAIENRLNSMVLVHEDLHSSAGHPKISFKDYIDKLSDHLIRAYGMDMKSIKIKHEVDDIFMSIDYAIPMGIIINELVTNSIKHAFTANSSGNILVRFAKKDNKYFLEVIDDGTGLPEGTDFDNPKLLGMQILKSLCSQLDGSPSYVNQNGCHFKLSFNHSFKDS
ncbi:MAG TPA: histidine kinase dimerization/phosphoacceptor domain -containing protein [Ignavibacteria bacterium]